jgi:hypothetical protein
MYGLLCSDVWGFCGQAAGMRLTYEFLCAGVYHEGVGC